MDNLIIPTLIVWTLARLFIFERGPFAIFAIIRAIVGVVSDSFGNPVAKDDNELAYVFSCLVCLSFWLAIPVTLYFQQPFYYVVVYTGGSIFLNRISN